MFLFHFVPQLHHVILSPVVGSKWASPARTPPYGPKFSRFHAVFGKIWQNCMLTPPEDWHPLLQGILEPPLVSNFVWVTLLIPSILICMRAVGLSAKACLQAVSGYIISCHLRASHWDHCVIIHLATDFFINFFLSILENLRPVLRRYG